VLWDVGAVAWLVNPDWVPAVVVHSPLLISKGTWSHDPRRHLIREALASTAMRSSVIYSASCAPPPTVKTLNDVGNLGWEAMAVRQLSARTTEYTLKRPVLATQ
jgi:hypothetical protein